MFLRTRLSRLASTAVIGIGLLVAAPALADIIDMDDPVPIGPIARSLVVPYDPKVTTTHVKKLLPKPKPKVISASVAPSGSSSGQGIWDCIAAKESGNRPLGCALYCGRLQWLPSTWRAAGGTRYASLPQHATYEQEVVIARAWLAKTSWGQWPNTSRMCGAR